MARENDNPNVSKYRRPPNINIGIIIFGVMFIYIIICVIMYTKEEHLKGYEVKYGSLSVNNTYKGIALRNEKVYYADSAGYIYYFTPDSTHVGCGDMIYATDSSGTLAEKIAGVSTDENLSNADYNGFKSKLVNFKSEFDVHNFNTTYDFRYDLKNEIAKINNTSILSMLDAVDGSNSIKKSYSDCAGTVVFYTDGYEELVPSDVTSEHFNLELYDKKQSSSNVLVGNGEPIYKLITNEDWSIVVPVPANRILELQDKEYIKVKFLKDQYETWAKITILNSLNFNNQDDNEKNKAEEDSVFVQLDFTNSMIDYASDRFLDIELILEEEKGLKIPNSSIANRNFFLIPSEYIVKSGAKGEEGVMRQSFTEDNEMTTEFVETSIYNIEDNTYYVDASALSVGDVIYKTDDLNAESYTVSKQAALTGVYNINKGYADFRQIEILYQNDEYAIVEANTNYGLNQYDYIALDASTVVDQQFTNQ